MKYIIDLDGTLMNGESANKDVVLFIEQLHKSGRGFIVMTNSMKSPSVIQKRLEKAGIKIEMDRVLNPISAINAHIESMGYQSAFIVGSMNEIEQIEIKHDRENPSIIVLLDFEKENVAFNQLQEVFELIKKGIPIIAASKSPYYLKGQKHVLDTGAFVKLFETAANVPIEVFGKPSKEYFLSGLKLLNSKPDGVTVIGDDWSTDIMGANGVGCNSILIRSGKYQKGDELKCEMLRCVDSFAEIL